MIHDLVRPPEGAVRAVRVSPRDPRAAPIIFVFTSFPGVVLHAGLLHDFPFPTCGCDACDETWEPLAGELEWHVHAVTAGRYGERVSPGPRWWVGYVIDSAVGDARSGESCGEGIPRDRLRAARERLRECPGRYAPWTER